MDFLQVEPSGVKNLLPGPRCMKESFLWVHRPKMFLSQTQQTGQQVSLGHSLASSRDTIVNSSCVAPPSAGLLSVFQSLLSPCPWRFLLLHFPVQTKADSVFGYSDFQMDHLQHSGLTRLIVPLQGSVTLLPMSRLGLSTLKIHCR